MRKYIIAYLIIIALLTGCSVQSVPEQNNSTSTLTENSASIKSSAIIYGNRYLCRSVHTSYFT